MCRAPHRVGLGCYTVFSPGVYLLRGRWLNFASAKFQNDGIAQFSGSFAKRSYQRSLSYNELSFVDQTSDFCDDNFFAGVGVDHSDFFRRQESNKKSNFSTRDFPGNGTRPFSRTPTSPNPYYEYFEQVRPASKGQLLRGG